MQKLTKKAATNNNNKNKIKNTTLNIVCDIAFKRSKHFRHSDIISQVIPGMRSKVSI